MSHSIISKYLAEVKDHIQTAKIGLQKGNNRHALGEFQLAGEKAIKAFVMYKGISIESTYSHRTKKLLDKISSHKRDEDWIKIYNLSSKLDNWGGFSGVTHDGTNFNWGPCLMHCEITYSSSLKPLIPTNKAIPQKELESYRKGALEIVNIIFQRLRMFR